MSQSNNNTESPANWGKSLTKQSAEAESNINNIIKLWTKTGELTHISQALGNYRDMSGIPDLHEAMNIVADAQSSFMELPAEIRKRVGHDVSNFLPFIDDPDNQDECIELGLIPAPKGYKTPEQREAMFVPTENPPPPITGGE